MSEPYWVPLGGSVVPVVPSIGTTLPASPVDGQLAVLVDSLTAPSYHWLFRYNAGSSHADKWGFVGGAPIEARTPANDNITSASFADGGTIGPSITVPRAGMYLLEFGLTAQPAASAILLTAPKYSAATPPDTDAARVHVAATAVSIWRALGQPVAIAAGFTVKLQYRVTVGNSAVYERVLRVTPVRVS